MNTNQIKSAFVQLGKIFALLGNNQPWPGFSSGLSEQEYANWQHLINTAHTHNGWFTPDNVQGALKAWGNNLQVDHLDTWLESYPSFASTAIRNKKVGVVMAGNIPMVGFHDLLSVLITGHTAIVKLSSNDNLLIPLAVKTMGQFEPEILTRVLFADRLNEMDAVIATGSNNTGRYFEQYFSKYPHIIRKNRNAVAVIEHETSAVDLRAIGDDVFTYFGLGCRNVTKLFLPEGFDIDRFFGAIYPYRDIINHSKYANNYDYHKALYLLNKEPLLDNGFILLREHSQLHSPLGVLHYEYYNKPEQVKGFIAAHEDQIQCVVESTKRSDLSVAPGHSQHPTLNDYADRVDTIAFLLNL